MRKILFILIALLTMRTATFAQTISAYASTTGVAPIPSFLKPEPAALVFVSVPIGKYITIDPDYTFSLKNGKPWFSDVWIHANIALDTAKKWIATAGGDPSFFWQESPTGLQTVGYPTIEGKLKYNANVHNAFTLDCQYMWPIPKADGAPVLYVSLAYAGSVENKMFMVTAVPNLFYLNSPGDSGAAGSIDVSVQHKKSGISIGFQMVKSITLPTDVFAKGLYIGYTHTL